MRHQTLFSKLLSSSVLGIAITVLATRADAAACDYTPSKLAGKTATAIGTSIAGGAATAGIGLQAAGYYTLVHAGSGLTMLGSTAVGASAAGTAGILAGTAGALGTVGAVLMAPITIVVGGITMVGVGAYEGVCYFQIERVTDPYKVREIIESIAEHDAAASIVPTEDGDALALKVSDQADSYLLRNLYISDGYLMHRDYGPNTNLGPVLRMTEAIEE